MSRHTPFMCLWLFQNSTSVTTVKFYLCEQERVFVAVTSLRGNNKRSINFNSSLEHFRAFHRIPDQIRSHQGATAGAVVQQSPGGKGSQFSGFKRERKNIGRFSRFDCSYELQMHCDGLTTSLGSIFCFFPMCTGDRHQQTVADKAGKIMDGCTKEDFNMRCEQNKQHLSHMQPVLSGREVRVNVNDNV